MDRRLRRFRTRVTLRPWGHVGPRVQDSSILARDEVPASDTSCGRSRARCLRFSRLPSWSLTRLREIPITAGGPPWCSTRRFASLHSGSLIALRRDALIDRERSREFLRAIPRGDCENAVRNAGSRPSRDGRARTANRLGKSPLPLQEPLGSPFDETLSFPGDDHANCCFLLYFYRMPRTRFRNRADFRDDDLEPRLESFGKRLEYIRISVSPWRYFRSG